MTYIARFKSRGLPLRVTVRCTQYGPRAPVWLVRSAVPEQQAGPLMRGIRV